MELTGWLGIIRQGRFQVLIICIFSLSTSLKSPNISPSQPLSTAFNKSTNPKKWPKIFKYVNIKIDFSKMRLWWNGERGVVLKKWQMGFILNYKPSMPTTPPTTSSFSKTPCISFRENIRKIAKMKVYSAQHFLNSLVFVL